MSTHRGAVHILLKSFVLSDILIIRSKIAYRNLNNTLLRHNCGNQFVVGDIECGVIDLYAVCGHALFVPHVGDFLGGTLFDVDVGAGGGGEVDGGTGGADVEGDAVVFGEDGDA